VLIDWCRSELTKVQNYVHILLLPHHGGHNVQEGVYFVMAYIVVHKL